MDRDRSLIPLVAVVGVGIAMFIAALLLLWYADAENEDYAAVFAAFGAGLAGAGGAVLAVYRQAQIDERKARQAREAFRRVLWSEASIAIHCLVQVAGVLHQVVTIFANRGEISGVLYEIRPSVIFTGSVARYPELDPDDIIALLFLNQAIEVYMRERAEFVRRGPEGNTATEFRLLEGAVMGALQFVEEVVDRFDPADKRGLRAAAKAALERERAGDALGPI